MPDPVASLFKGTLDLLVLRTLDLQPLHGAAVAERILQTIRGTFQIKAGSLFPALHRLEQNALIEGEWETPPKGRRIKSYRLTREGRRRLWVKRHRGSAS
jgi:DNA-binding PadR family transcriptional regulator